MPSSQSTAQVFSGLPHDCCYILPPFTPLFSQAIFTGGRFLDPDIQSIRRATMLAPSGGLSLFFWLFVFLHLSVCVSLRAQHASNRSDSIAELKTRAESGDLSAQTKLGEFLMDADPSADSYDSALDWLRSAVARKNAHAEFVLGYLYHHGHGVPRDYAQAAQYYQRAVLDGHDIAPNNLGVLYQHGFGVSKNPARALELFRISAERGYATAQYNVAVAYSLGIGSQRDPYEAAHWFRASADLGYAPAQRALGVLYC